MRIVIPGILLLYATTALAQEAERETPARPIVGTIRWDAWSGGNITEQVERTLGPKKYHDRLPWFAEVIADGKVEIDGGPQSVMDREIELARAAGLDYWAFLLYRENSSMSTALKQYLKSLRREKVRFCLILHNTLNVSDAEWPKERDRAVALLKEPGYQKVLGGRPLVYVFCGGGFPQKRFDEFRTAATAAGLKPYFVYMGWHPATDFRRMHRGGFDAVSAYAKSGEQPTFAALVRAAEADWRNAAGASASYVPLVTAGWDKRPRKDNAVSWEKDHAYHRQEVFPSRATPEEIAGHLGRAVKFVQSNCQICPANAIIIYAWNEYDEGGWLAPTRGADGKPDTSRLDAVRGVLKKQAKRSSM